MDRIAKSSPTDTSALPQRTVHAHLSSTKPSDTISLEVSDKLPLQRRGSCFFMTRVPLQLQVMSLRECNFEPNKYTLMFVLRVHVLRGNMALCFLSGSARLSETQVFKNHENSDNFC